MKYQTSLSSKSAHVLTALMVAFTLAGAPAPAEASWLSSLKKKVTPKPIQKLEEKVVNAHVDAAKKAIDFKTDMATDKLKTVGRVEEMHREGVITRAGLITAGAVAPVAVSAVGHTAGAAVGLGAGAVGAAGSTALGLGTGVAGAAVGVGSGLAGAAVGAGVGAAGAAGSTALGLGTGVAGAAVGVGSGLAGAAVGAGVGAAGAAGSTALGVGTGVAGAGLGVGSGLAGAAVGAGVGAAGAAGSTALGVGTGVAGAGLGVGSGLAGAAVGAGVGAAGAAGSTALGVGTGVAGAGLGVGSGLAGAAAGTAVAAGTTAAGVGVGTVAHTAGAVAPVVSMTTADGALVPVATTGMIVASIADAPPSGVSMTTADGTLVPVATTGMIVPATEGDAGPTVTTAMVNDGRILDEKIPAPTVGGPGQPKDNVGTKDEKPLVLPGLTDVAVSTTIKTAQLDQPQVLPAETAEVQPIMVNFRGAVAGAGGQGSPVICVFNCGGEKPDMYGSDIVSHHAY